MQTPIINFEKLNKPHWSEQARQNARKTIEFVQLIMNDHNFDEVAKHYSGTPYKQHNRTIADSIDGVIKTVGALTKTSPEFSYDVKHLYVDGDHVILHSHATLKAKHRGDDSQGLNIIDIWKIEEGNLVEHWDAVEGISFPMRLYGLMTGGAVRNDNGVF